jgi:hypothetical protein
MTKKSVARRMKLAMVVLVAVAMILPASLAGAEAAAVRLIGSVQWIGGLGMALALDTGGSIRVDLTSVELTDYQGLTSGDRVVVTGVLSSRRDHVVATAIAPAR